MLKPLNETSYNRTTGTVFRYAVADFSCEIDACDVTGAYYVTLIYGYYRERRFVFETDCDTALALPAKVVARYPARAFNCQADY